MGHLSYRVEYHEKVEREDIPALGSVTKDRVRKAIETKLIIAPDIFGKPLRRSLAGRRKLRVGDYRIIYRVEKMLVKILVIGHRSWVYKEEGTRRSS